MESNIFGFILLSSLHLLPGATIGQTQPKARWVESSDTTLICHCLELWEQQRRVNRESEEASRKYPAKMFIVHINLPIPFLEAYFLIGEDIARIRHFEIGGVKTKGTMFIPFPSHNLLENMQPEYSQKPFPEYANHLVTVQ